MKRTVLTYGLISGAVASVCMSANVLLLHDALDSNYGMVFGYAGILLGMMFVLLGMRAYRDQVQGGSISFGKAFQVGLLITLISCVCYVLTWMFVYHNFMPDFMDKYAAHSIAQLRASGASELQISQETLEMDEFRQMYKNPFLFFLMTFAEPFPVGLLVTVIGAAVLKRKVV